MDWKFGLHPEDIDLANRVWKAYKRNNDLRAILFAPMQSGKTYKNIAIYKKFAYELSKSNTILQVFLFGPSNNALKDQNIRRYVELGIFVDKENHYITWGASSRNEKIANNIELARNYGHFVLFLQDEADEGTGDDQEPSDLRDFFGRYNIPLLDIISNRSGKEFAAFTTATPAHYIEPYREAYKCKGNNNPNVKVFHCKPGANYSSILQLYKNNHFFDAQSVNQVLEICDGIETMYAKNDYGYIVVRASSEKQNDLRKKIDEMLQQNTSIVANDYDYENFDCGLGNIKELDNVLGITPTKPTVIFIKRAAGRGVTIPTENIIQWHDNCSHEAATLQSCGRFSGYPRKDKTGKLLKKNRADVRIFTNLSHIENNISLYEKAESGATDKEIHNYLMKKEVHQTGTHNKAYRNQRTYERSGEYSTSEQQFVQDFANIVNGNVLFRVEKGGPIAFTGTPSVTNCSTNNNNSIASFFLRAKNGTYRRQVSPDSVVFCNPASLGSDLVSGVTKAYSIINLDAPNLNYQEDWNKLLGSYHGYWIIEATYTERISNNTSGVKLA